MNRNKISKIILGGLVIIFLFVAAFSADDSLQSGALRKKIVKKVQTVAVKKAKTTKKTADVKTAGTSTDATKRLSAEEQTETSIAQVIGAETQGTSTLSQQINVPGQSIALTPDQMAQMLATNKQIVDLLTQLITASQNQPATQINMPQPQVIYQQAQPAPQPQPAVQPQPVPAEPVVPVPVQVISAPPPPDIETNLIAHLPFDEKFGTGAMDISVDGNNPGSHQKGPVISRDTAPTVFENPRSLNFDGVNDYVDISNLRMSEFANGFTWSGWVKTDAYSASWEWFASASTRSASGYPYFQCGKKAYDGNIRFETGSFTASTGTTTPVLDTFDVNIADGKWHHLACVWDAVAGKKYIYVDGGRDKARSAAPKVDVPADHGTLRIGANGISEYWKGNIDEVRIYKRPLSQEAITELAKTSGVQQQTPAKTDKVLHLTFDDVSGGVINNAANSLIPATYIGDTPTLADPAPTTFANSKSLSFDGVDDAVLVENMHVPSTNYSIAAWFKTSDSNGSFFTVIHPASGRAQASSYDREFGIKDGKLCHRLYTGSIPVLCSPNVYNDNNWHFGVVTVSATDGTKLYVDGVGVNGEPVESAPSMKQSAFTWETGVVIGNHVFWGPYAGLLDDLTVYNRVLGGTEIAAMSPPPPPPPPVVPVLQDEQPPVE